MTDERQPVPDWADMIAERDATILNFKLLLEEVYVFLGSIDDASELRDRIMSVLGAQEKTDVRS